MHGEALAHANYRFYAAQAGRQRLRGVQALFTKTAATELHDHLTQEARLVHFVHDDITNLCDSIKGELEEATRLYPRFAAQARQDGDDNAARLTALGAATGQPRATVFGITAAIGVATYALNGFAPHIGAGALRYATPFHYYIGTHPLTSGFDPAPILAMTGATLLLLALGTWRFTHRDLGRCPLSLPVPEPDGPGTQPSTRAEDPTLDERPPPAGSGGGGVDRGVRRDNRDERERILASGQVGV
ncbi:ferritin family protein [Actinomadura harenae]|uniref:Uncharacterized protein n=1 Tax=Actinomadura harenae TaxID=2483351 RepID=A0A3M2LFN9_9ACTN|nr:hypothetical protein [Actinomadura harenae]RMI36317.1 hypothetical protein EBO15_38995 [Actinomadura harenae]